MEPSPETNNNSNNSNNHNQYFRVYLRLRPSFKPSNGTTRFINASLDKNHIYISPPTTHTSNRAPSIDKYSFTRVFDESSQQVDVFIETALPLVRDAITKGHDGMLATLGVTGSGKTHTILGSRDQRGIIQMSLDVVYSSLVSKGVGLVDMFTVAANDRTDAALVMDAPTFVARMTAAMDGGGGGYNSKRSSMGKESIMPTVPDVSGLMVDPPAEKTGTYAVVLSMYELYNDRVYDLLDETPFINPGARRKTLVFRKPSAVGDAAVQPNKKAVCGLRKVYARTLSEALQVVEHGQACRKVSATNSNAHSSRSHTFLQIEIKRYSKHSERSSSSLQIVDLAGSERARNAQTAGDRLVEAGSINRSLMLLGQCLQTQMAGLNASSSNHNMATTTAATWRNSKLTEIMFHNTFSGASRQHAVMIVTADATGDYNSTRQILLYSALAREVTVSRQQPNARAASAMSNHSITSSSSSSDEAIEPEPSSKDALIARLVSELEESEVRWRDAEQRCLTIEQCVREEVMEEMDGRLEALRREALETRVRENMWRDEFVDEKIDILRKGLAEVRVYEDEDGYEYKLGYNTGGRSLEAENENLRKELSLLRRELGNRTPTASTKRGRMLGGIENGI